jgi:ParB family chromosome partitioning protein
MQTQIEIPLSKLKLDPANVRKTDTAPTEQFISSLREQGVLEALIVRKNGAGFYVTNGGKRLAALNVLVKEGTLKADHPVPCVPREIDDKAARDISLTVNYMRESMHPVDEYEAFAGLLADGLTAEDISKKYGLTKREVSQVLALGNLAPEIRQAWREEKIQEDAAEAFTLEPDQKKQSELFEKLRKGHGLNEWTVKKAIIGEDQKKSGMIAYVGIEAYKKAGGAVAQDLFADAKNPADIAVDLKLLKKLYDEKLSGKVGELIEEGWKWVQYASELPNGAQWWEAKGKNNVKADDRSKYGVIICIDYHGEVEIKYGVQKPAEKSKAEKSKAEAKGDASAPGISAALAGRISAQMGEAAAQVLKTDSNLALAIVAAALTSHDSPVKISGYGGAGKAAKFSTQIDLMRKKSAGDLHKVLADIAAFSLSIGASSQDNLPLAKASDNDRALLEALDPKKLNAQLRANFDAADYFAGLTAQVAKDAIALCDPKQPITGKEKKSELAALAADLVKKSNAGGKPGWLPPEMRTKAYDGPKAKAAPAKTAKKPAKKKGR